MRRLVQPARRRGLGRIFETKHWLIPLAFGLLAAGTEAAETDGASPAAVAATDAELLASNLPIRLPPFVVSAMRTDKHPWRYASVGAFEILSRASKHDTYWLVDPLHRGMWLEDYVLPEQWRPRSPVPYSVIVDNTKLKASRRDEMPGEVIAFAPPADAFLWGMPAHALDTWSETIAARDSDTYAMGVDLRAADTRALAYGWISIERLRRCAPPLPRWLMAGLVDRSVGLFRSGFVPLREPLQFDRGGQGDGGFGAAALAMDPNAVTKVLGPGTLWISAEETKRIRAALDEEEKRRQRPVKRNVSDAILPPIAVSIPFLPLSQIFSERPPPDPELALWKSEAALFVRWGLVGPGRADPAMAKAFVQFGERARREPVTERTFVECFGFDYAVMEKRLDTFLREVIARPVILDLEFPSNLPRPKLQPATADQIGRILGDWLRLQAAALRPQAPALSGEFMYAAGAMLFRAYQIDNGLPPDAAPKTNEPVVRASRATAADRAVVLAPLKVSSTRIRDADLLAVYGLYEHDAGNVAEARAFLEKAVRWGAARPRAAIVLAQLRYAEARANPAGTEGRLSAQQAAFVLDPLSAALRASTDAEIYALIVNTWSHCDAAPPPGELERMAEGASRYPRETRLVSRAAMLFALAGDVSRARALFDQALVFETDDTHRSELLRRRAMLQE